ncbi:MAG TPA: DUF3800 domain-containing protein [Pyrinomonadaceae bacterium]|nr:DUF3800 domain-containing protein [Pyrinomonadaceae bacterium]
MSALAIRHSEWKQCFDLVREHRVNLKRDHGIYLSKEIHARDLVHGRGRISPTPIGKWQRTRIFQGMLKLAASLPRVLLFNVCLDTGSHKDPQMTAWDRLTNRIERTMLEFERNELPLRRDLTEKATEHLSTVEGYQIERRLNIYRSRAVIFADEGRETEITRALRKMHVFNPIPSRLGEWPSGEPTKNITIDRIVEDPNFKRSDRSYLIQLADCIAFALLKREVAPTPVIAKYGVDEMFDEALRGICYRKASPDPLGIVRH